MLPNLSFPTALSPRSASMGIRFVLLAALLVAASPTFAQNVSMAGSYSSASGKVFVLPQDGNIEYTCSTAQDARCIRRQGGFFGSPTSTRLSRAEAGIQNTGTDVPAIANIALFSTGAPITVPPSFFQLAGQDGLNRRPVLNDIVAEIETDFSFMNPAPARAKLPPVQTRRLARRALAPTNPVASGQNNGLPITNPGYQFRSNVDTTVTETAGGGLEVLQLRYSGGLGFSGTMATLLRGNLEFYVTGPVIDNSLPTSFHPGVIRGQIGDGFSVPFSENHGAGWDYTVMRTQPPGTIKGFPSAPSVVGIPCFATPPAVPAGCNDVSGFETNGIPLGTTPGALSTRHLFAWTTGTVSVVRTAIRDGITLTLTMTAMGYDIRSPGGTATPPVRRIGLVAGSYTKRNMQELEPGLVGMELVLTPEPAATVSLATGLGLLGLLARRRA